METKILEGLEDLGLVLTQFSLFHSNCGAGVALRHKSLTLLLNAKAAYRASLHAMRTGPGSAGRPCTHCVQG